MHQKSLTADQQPVLNQDGLSDWKVMNGVWWRTNHGPNKPHAQFLPLKKSTIITRQSSIKINRI